MDVTRGQRWLVAIFFASVVVLIQSAWWYRSDDEYSAWAVACSAVSTVVCLLLVIFLAAKGETSILEWVAVLFFLLWLFGTGIMTFKSPFTHTNGGQKERNGEWFGTSNGYFGSWFAFSLSLFFLLDAFPQLKAPYNNLVENSGHGLTILLFASVIVIVQVAVKHNWDEWEFILQIAISCFSAFICILLAIPPVASELSKSACGIALILLLIWTVAAGIGTFHGPYVALGNGYFGDLVAFMAAAIFFGKAWGLVSEVGGGSLPYHVVCIFIASIVVVTEASLICDNCRVAQRLDDGNNSWSATAWGFGTTRQSVNCPDDVTLRERCGDYTVLALCVACLSALICLAWSLAQKFCKGCLSRVVMTIASLLLFLLWLVATNAGTFKDPFRLAGNGYFGEWIALILSGMLFLEYCPVLQPLLSDSSSNGKEMMIVLVASIVLLAQSALDCTRNGSDWDTVRDYCNGERALAIACAAVSFAVCFLAIVLRGCLASFMAYVAGFLILWWGAALCIFTFDAPYAYTGNGYFSCWAGFTGSLWLLIICLDGRGGGQNKQPHMASRGTE